MSGLIRTVRGAARSGRREDGFVLLATLVGLLLAGGVILYLLGLVLSTERSSTALTENARRMRVADSAIQAVIVRISRNNSVGSTEDAKGQFGKPGNHCGDLAPDAGQTLRTKFRMTIDGRVAEITCNPINRSEVNTITINATGGTFRVVYQGNTTAPVAFDASAATLQAALDTAFNDPGNPNAPGVAGDVTVTKSGSVFTLTASSSGTLAGKNVNVTTLPAGLSGGASTAVVATTTQGNGPEGLIRRMRLLVKVGDSSGNDLETRGSATLRIVDQNPLNGARANGNSVIVDSYGLCNQPSTLTDCVAP